MIATLVAVLIAAGFVLLFRFRIVVFIFFFGVFISTAIRPLVGWLFRRGVPRWAGIIIVYAGFVLFVTAVAISGAPLVVEQTTNFSAQLPELYERLRASLIQGRIGPIFRVGLRLPAEMSLLAAPATTTEEALPLLRQTLDQLSVAARVALGIVATLLISFYWTLDGERVKRSIVLLFPRERREEYRELLNDLEDRLGQYTVGVVILMVIIGALSYVAYLLIGLPNALFLAILAGLMEGVPTIGPPLAAIPAALVAFSISPTHVLWVIVASIVIQQLENIVLVPRVMGNTVGVHPVVTLLAFLAFTILFGVVGALVAIPLAATLSVLFRRFLLAPESANAIEPGGRDRLSVLRYETQQLLADVAKRERREPGGAELDDERAALRDSLEGLVMELDELLSEFANGDDEENGS